MSEATNTFTVPETTLVQRLGVSRSAVRKYREKLPAEARGAVWDRVKNEVCWTEAGALVAATALTCADLAPEAEKIAEKTAADPLPSPELAEAAKAPLRCMAVVTNCRLRNWQFVVVAVELPGQAAKEDGVCRVRDASLYFKGQQIEVLHERANVWVATRVPRRQGRF